MRSHRDQLYRLKGRPEIGVIVDYHEGLLRLPQTHYRISETVGSLCLSTRSD